MGRRTTRFIVVLGLAMMLAACTSSGGSSAAQWPTSMVAVGHSGLTAWNSDPVVRGGQDIPENSWATGTNPAVNSIYLRELAGHPALKGHNFNVAKDGSTVDDLSRQVGLALAEVPLPDLFILQTVDNDIRCDGTDPQNYGPFGATLHAALAEIAKGAPKAQIWIIGITIDEQSYVDATKHMPNQIAQNSKGGPCDYFTPQGEVLSKAVAYQGDVVDHYNALVRSVCAEFPQCHDDGGATEHMKIDESFLGPDGAHATVHGLATMADVAWEAFHG